MKKIYLLALSLLAAQVFATPYTLLDANEYHDAFNSSRTKVTALLQDLKSHRNLSADEQVAHIANQLMDTPYQYKNGMGEGDWQPKSMVYKPNAIHLKQNPVYRLDGLNCQTLVQVAMALYYSGDLSEFDKNYVKIAYGAAGNPNGEIVHFYNRNHFVDADFNPVNQKNGLLTDVTSSSPHAKQIHATLTRKEWFMRQRYKMERNIRVLSDETGKEMLKRYKSEYAHLQYPQFDAKPIVMSYIPKEKLAIRQEDDSFKPNQALLDSIPTPAIAEIVRDPKRWGEYGYSVKGIIGTEMTVSHLGLLYRKNFKQGQLIYKKTTCMPDKHHQGEICEVRPVICEKKNCRELMFTHATNAFPKRYYWYQTADGNFTCSPHRPKKGEKFTICNRVVSLPFYDYLTDYQMGYYWNMDVGSIVGVHVEKLNPKKI